MDLFIKFIKDNIIWIITMLFSVGCCYSILNQNTKDINLVKDEQIIQDNRTLQLEKSSIKIDYIQNDVTEIKSDIKDIKSVIFKPITLNSYANCTKSTK